MKIAMIVPYAIFPPNEGGRVRAYNLLKHLADEHEMTLLTPRSPANARLGLPVTVHELTPPGRWHQIVNPRFISESQRIFRKQRPDIVLIEYPWPGFHGAYLSRAFKVPMVLDAPNVEADRFRSTGALYWRLVALFENFVTRLAERVFVVSEADRERYASRGVARDKVQVVPNGIDPEVVRPDPEAGSAVRAHLGIDDNTRLLLFFGQLDYAPNRSALGLLDGEVIPRLNGTGEPYEIVVAGKGDITRLRALYAHTRMRFIGPVPSLVPYINAADAVLAPIVAGGGTRLKVLESIGCGTAVVSTTTGAEGIDATACGDLLVVEDNWDAFAAAALEQRRSRRRAPPAEFLDTYAWERVVARIRWPDPRPH